jgi:hypothetical protein
MVMSMAATSTDSAGGVIASLGVDVRRIKNDDVARTSPATIKSERFCADV